MPPMATHEQAFAVLVVLGHYWSVLRKGGMSEQEAFERYPQLMGASLALLGFLRRRDG